MLEKHAGIHVLRDDLLPGGTKSVLMPALEKHSATEYVYASPVYGGFQIAIAAHFSSKAHIFCARHKNRHANTLNVLALGAKVTEIRPGYLSTVQARAREYCIGRAGAHMVPFGADDEQYIDILARRAHKVLAKLGFEPNEVWCAVGSGTLARGILRATDTAVVHGVAVGKEFGVVHPRLVMHRHKLPFHASAKATAPFPSMPNYDLKAWEMCQKQHNSKSVLFWNVL